MSQLLPRFFICLLSFASISMPGFSQILAANNVDKPKTYVQVKHPEWSKKAVIYQVNIRQYTPEGTIKAFMKELPRLKNLGIDILWLMPIHPIGELHRKGSLGSPYAVKDYYGINPELGSMSDFQNLVKAIHAQGMYVILDWVANHSAWDHPLTKTHPEWYTKNDEGNFQPTPWYDWDDIIDFDYQQPGIRRYMIDAMKFWVKEQQVDGFRCDVAGFIPVDFWNQARKELEMIKSVFLLAEWESRDLHEFAFDMTYSWSLYDALAKACSTVDPQIHTLTEYLAHDVNTFPHEAFRMCFTDNHDKNSWTATPFQQFGKGYEAALVFSFVVKGMPLIYSGQEAGNPKQLRFFDKDTIQWKYHPFTLLIKRLIALKHQHPSLWNGAWGGEMKRIVNDRSSQVISFCRVVGEDKVISVFNFSDQAVTTTLKVANYQGKYQEMSSKKTVQMQDSITLQLPAWGYQIFEITH